MKTIKEQLLEIMNSYEIDDSHNIFIPVDAEESIISEIETLIKENYVEKEKVTKSYKKGFSDGQRNQSNFDCR